MSVKAFGAVRPIKELDYWTFYRTTLYDMLCMLYKYECLQSYRTTC